MVSNKCKICHTGNDRMCNIKNTLLERLFEIISKEKINTIDGRAETFCYICHDELQECKKLYDKLIRSTKIIQELSSISGLELTQESITALLNQEMTKRVTVTSTTVNSEPLDKPAVTVKQQADNTSELAQQKGAPSFKKRKIDDLQQEGKYRCKKCKKTFEHKRQLSCHMISHKKRSKERSAL